MSLTRAVVLAGALGLSLAANGAPRPASPPSSHGEAGSKSSASSPKTAAETFFDHIGKTDGLPEATVTAIAQDAAGFMWFGTQQALARYDGYTFTVFQPRAGDPDSISGRVVTDILANRDGSLWVATSHGLNRYDPATRTFDAYRHTASDDASLRNDFVTELARTADGALLIGTNDGLDRLEAPTQENATVAFEHLAFDVAVNTLFVDADGTLWIGTDGGLWRHEPGGEFNPVAGMRHREILALAFRNGTLWIGTHRAGLFRLDDGESTRVALGPGRDPNRDWISALAFDRAGRLWAGTRNGLFRRSANGVWRGWRPDPTDPHSLSQQAVFSIFQGAGGVIWIGTHGGGLNKYLPSREQFRTWRHRPGDPTSLAQDIVMPILEARDGAVWVGTYGKGLDRLDPKAGVFSHYRHDPGNPDSLGGNAIRALLETRDGMLWVGTTASGLDRLDPATGVFTHYRHEPGNPDSLGGRSVVALIENADGSLWIGLWDGRSGGGLDRFDPATGEFAHYHHDPADPASLGGNRVAALYKDRQGRLWVGTDDGGLNRYDAGTGGFVKYPQPSSNPGRDSIMSITGGKPGVLWLGTRAGLEKLDIASGEFRLYDTSDGLADNLVLCVLRDPRGILWISTNNGLSQFDPQTERFRTWRESDGLQGNEYNSFSCARGRDGTLYFGGIGGFSAFDPSALEINRHRPPVVLTSLLLENRPVPIADADADAGFSLPKAPRLLPELTLDYHRDVLSFEFAALDYAHPAANRYQYKLEGFDDRWLKAPANRRVATYTNLDSGSYLFRVRAANDDGVWNNTGASIRLRILPPPWQTWWAYTLYGVAIALLLAMVFRYFLMRREMDYAARENRMKSAFFAMMSHEIRTPLNGMLGMLQLLQRSRLDRRQRDYADNARDAGDALLAIVNDVLDYSKIDAGRIEFEVTDFSLGRLLESMVMLMQTRATEKGLRLDAAVEPTVPDVLRGDPARLRQVILNLIGNAIKFTETGGIRVSVARTDGDNRLRFTVTDSGIGIAEEKRAALFEMFSQADTSIRRRFGGTGLGLAICKRLVEGQGGRIGVDSTSGRGSSFWFELEMPAGDPADVDDVQDEPAGEAAPLRILVADDVSINRQVAVGLLEHAGHAVVSVADGGAAIDRIANDPDFDVILLDVRMPGLDGIEATRRIRAMSDASGACIPIIGLTASVDTEDFRICLDAGMNTVLAKPVRAGELRAALAHETITETDHQDFDKALFAAHRQGLGQQGMMGLIDTFGDLATRTLAEVDGALEGGDRDTLSDAAHRLGGAAASLGLRAISRTASNLERRAAGGEMTRLYSLVDELRGLVEADVAGLKSEMESGDDDTTRLPSGKGLG